MRTLIAAVFVVVLATGARAETPVSLRKTGELRWGADHTGGAPYVWEENGKLIGFELELAEYLARELGVRAVPKHGQWDMLPAMLNRGDLDIVLNGYEWFPDREKEWASTVPYYLYKLQLIVRKDNSSIRDWTDLKRGADGRRKRVGVLLESAAQRYLDEHFGEDAQVEPNKDVTSAMVNVRTGQNDATVQDVPTTGYNLSREFRDLRTVGDAVAPTEYPYYVIFVRRSDPELVKRSTRPF